MRIATSTVSDSIVQQIQKLGSPIGKQDQYAAAIGGLNYIKFWANGTVSVKPILIDEPLILSIMDSLFYIYMGVSHDASQILGHLNGQMDRAEEHLLRMRDLTDTLYHELMNRNISQYACALRENWELKKQTSTLVATFLPSRSS